MKSLIIYIYVYYEYYVLVVEFLCHVISWILYNTFDNKVIYGHVLMKLVLSFMLQVQLYRIIPSTVE